MYPFLSDRRQTRANFSTPLCAFPAPFSRSAPSPPPVPRPIFQSSPPPVHHPSLPCHPLCPFLPTTRLLFPARPRRLGRFSPPSPPSSPSPPPLFVPPLPSLRGLASAFPSPPLPFSRLALPHTFPWAAIGFSAFIPQSLPILQPGTRRLLFTFFFFFFRRSSPRPRPLGSGPDGNAAPRGLEKGAFPPDSPHSFPRDGAHARRAQPKSRGARAATSVATRAEPICSFVCRRPSSVGAMANRPAPACEGRPSGAFLALRSFVRVRFQDLRRRL